LQRTLHDADEQVIREFHDVLGDARDGAAADLQRNVYKNYHEFVTISKEIARLEGDMTLLRTILNDMKLANNAMREASTVVSSSTFPGLVCLIRLATKTEAAEEVSKQMQGMQISPSMASLESISVQGLDKVLDPSDSRRLVHSGGTLLELSASTLKARVPISFLLYNDVLVVAQRRRNLLGPSKLVLDKCWELSGISVIDIKDTDVLLNGFKIVRHPEEFFYKATSADEKAAWIQAIKRAADEFILSRRQTLKNQVEEQPASPVSSATPKASQPDLPPLTIADANWVNELEDELDVWSATREFEDAVKAIGKARSRFAAHQLTHDQRQIQLGVEARATRLSTIISQDLADPLLTKSQVVRNIQWLTRLGFASQARTIFLAARTSIMRHRIRQLPFHGDVTRYIGELAIVVFTLIKNTCDWYNAGFNDGTMSSGLLKWVKTEIEHYASIFRRQVFDSNQSFDVIAECLEMTIEESRVVRCFWRG